MVGTYVVLYLVLGYATEEIAMSVGDVRKENMCASIPVKRGNTLIKGLTGSFLPLHP